jgi:hypothetical protein
MVSKISQINHKTNEITFAERQIPYLKGKNMDLIYFQNYFVRELQGKIILTDDEAEQKGMN